MSLSLLWWKCIMVWNVHMSSLREKNQRKEWYLQNSVSLRLRFSELQVCKPVGDCIFTACALFTACAPLAPGTGVALWSLLLELEIHSKPTFLSFLNLDQFKPCQRWFLIFWFCFQISQAWCWQYLAWPGLFLRAPFKATKDLNLCMHTHTHKTDKHLKL